MGYDGKPIANLNPYREYILAIGAVHKRKNFVALVDVFNYEQEKNGFAH